MYTAINIFKDQPKILKIFQTTVLIEESLPCLGQQMEFQKQSPSIMKEGRKKLVIDDRVVRSFLLKGFILFYFSYLIQQCFICCPSDSTVSEDAEIEPRRTVATSAFTIRQSNHSARSHPHFFCIHILYIHSQL